MDDFDRLLEQDLARMLDPIVATPAPRRRRLGSLPVIELVRGIGGTQAEVSALPEPAVVTLAVPTAPLA